MYKKMYGERKTKMNNTLIVIGRIVKDIDLKYASNNNPFTKINLAINNGKDDTTYLPITVFGKMAETIYKYCKKGDLIGVNATVKNQNWEDSQGNKHYDYSFIANKVSFLSSKAKEIKEEIKKDNTSVFEEFGEQLEIDTDKLLD